MKLKAKLPAWSTIAPVVTWGVLATPYAGLSTATWPYQLLVLFGLVIGILAAVFHAEVVAHRVGKPYSTWFWHWL
jgi:Ca2+:H+ antiporter